MIHKTIGVSLLAIALSVTTLTAKSTVTDFNYGWEFALAPESGESVGANFQPVKIPHDWSIQEGYTTEKTAGSNGFLPGGLGYYTKNFTIPKSSKDKLLFIRFQGVYAQSEVVINDKKVGFYPNGYLDFEYDITPYIKFGQENNITVKVDRREYAESRWYVGGGIYRNVELIEREKSYITTHGVLITPTVKGNVATVDIKTDIKSQVIPISELRLCHTIIKDGRVVTTTDSDTATIKDPELWSLDNPQIYQLESELYHGKKLIDKKISNFGVRTVVCDPNNGILLNGKSIKVKGVNIHHDMGSMGVAHYDDVLHRRLLKLKEVGCNAIRTAHNPHSESLLAMCDTMGFLVMNEIFDDWRVSKNKWITERKKSDAPKDISTGYTKFFNEYAKSDTKHFIRRDYNHPSVIMWSMGNEIEWTYPYYFRSSPKAKTTGYYGLGAKSNPTADSDEVKRVFAQNSGGKDELSETAHEIRSWMREVDTSRPITSGVVLPNVSRISGYTDALDIVGYNYKDEHYEYDHKQYPEKMIFGSENVGQYFEWKAVVDKPYIPGIFLWTGIDYLGENGPYPLKGALYSLYDFACFKTPRGHFFETLWRETPKTYLVTTPASESEFKMNADGSYKVVLRSSALRRWEWFDCYERWNYNDGEKIIAQVYSNAPEVELLLNGKSLGTKRRSDYDDYNVLVWEVPYSAGTLVAIGKDGSKELSRCALRTAGAVDKIVAKADKIEVVSDGYALSQIELELQDRNGIFCDKSGVDINIELSSNLILMAVDNGSYKYVGDLQSTTIPTNNGRALVTVQPVRESKGIGTIKTRLPNGSTTTIEIKCLRK